MYSMISVKIVVSERKNNILYIFTQVLQWWPSWISHPYKTAYYCRGSCM